MQAAFTGNLRIYQQGRDWGNRSAPPEAGRIIIHITVDILNRQDVLPLFFFFFSSLGFWLCGFGFRFFGLGLSCFGCRFGLSF